MSTARPSGPAPDLRIERVDPADDAASARWHRVAARSGEHDRGEHATVWTLPELTAELRAERRARSVTAYVGTLDGEAVAFGLATLPMLDNTSTAEVAVLATTCRTCGSLAVVVGGRVVDRLDLGSRRTRSRQVVATRTFPVRSGRLVLRSLGGGRTTVDGFAVGR